MIHTSNASTQEVEAEAGRLLQVAGNLVLHTEFQASYEYRVNWLKK